MIDNTQPEAQNM